MEELGSLWWREAEANNVLPLDDRAQARAFARDPETDARHEFVFYPGARLLTPVTGPNFAMRPFRIIAHLQHRDRDGQGVLFAYGRRAAGFSLFVRDEQLWFDYNLAGRRSVLSAGLSPKEHAHTLGCA